jgi:alkylmercury lyase
VTEKQSALAAAGLALLRPGQPVTVEELAKRAERTPGELEALGDRVAMDAEGRIIGLCGLSLEPSPHRLTLAGVGLYTWCAYDAVGIPAAMGLDATVETSCPLCGVAIALDITAGWPRMEAALVAWRPTTAPGSAVRQEFCPSANLFCSRSHFDAWYEGAGHPEGRIANLEDLAQEGASNRAWG